MSYIARDPKILFGKPHIGGTRVGVDFLLDQLRAGSTPEELLRHFPRLPPQAIPELMALLESQQAA
jgi:uncharacterized protein (DUF433 family)